MRFAEIPYGLGDVMCLTYAVREGSVKSTCVDTSDIGLAIIFTFTAIGMVSVIKGIFKICGKAR